MQTFEWIRNKEIFEHDFFFNFKFWMPINCLDDRKHCDLYSTRIEHVLFMAIHTLFMINSIKKCKGFNKYVLFFAVLEFYQDEFQIL